MTGVLITEPGMYFDMPPEAYFSEPCPAPAITNSGITVLLEQSPLHFAWKHPAIGQPAEERDATAAMHRGSVVHRLALGAGKDFEVIDAPDYKTRKARELRNAAVKAGLVPILATAFEEAKPQARLIREHLDAVLMGRPFLPEVVIAWQIDTPNGRVWARAMIDAWCPDLMKAVDLKSTTDASEGAITRKMANDGYDRQDAWYTRGLEHVLGAHGQVSFCTLFSETKPPFASHPVSITEGWRSSAWEDCEMAVNLFAKCLKADAWPGYPREIARLLPPDWLIARQLNKRIQWSEAA